MCVDDYKFRHFSATRERICKRFIFREQDKKERVFLVNISQFQRFDDLCLCQILMHLNRKGLNIKDYQFEMEDLGITIEAGDRCLIPFDSLNRKDVPINMIKIQENNNYTGVLPQTFHEFEGLSLYNDNIQPQSSIIDQFVPSFQKKTKSPARTKEREKTIRQALYLVKYWRYLHEKCNLSLKNAAQIVGVSKKTLDDYFLVIRVGELHFYDFKTNIQEKIGHLRAFIKNQKIKIKGRLSKIVTSFVLVDQPKVDHIIPIKDWSKVKQIQQQSQSNSTFPDLTSMSDY